jgi:hypothetical protein
MTALPTSLRHLLDRHAAALPRAQDPADMGTCLGLEMRLGAVLPPGPQAVHAPAPVAPAAPHWWQRPLAAKAQPT